MLTASLTVNNIIPLPSAHMMAMLLLWVLLALTSSTSGQSWSQVEGNLTYVSVGGAGVWGVGAGDKIYYREVR